MILDAQSQSQSASQCARWLNVTFNTYKKWATYYGVYDNVKNQSGKGIKKGYATYKISLEDIFEGKTESKYTCGSDKEGSPNKDLQCEVLGSIKYVAGAP